jgi:lysophospholipid hydrolase
VLFLLSFVPTPPTQLPSPPSATSPSQSPSSLRRIVTDDLCRRVEIQIGKYKNSHPRAHPQRPTTMSDFARLARRLCGKSIGVVLGGGGARGISHIGVLRALSEQGIPIDMVGGTSIGAFVGGLYAREGDLVATFGRAKRFSGRMSTLWRVLTDLTYPVVAYTTGELHSTV